jgi:hypothetical protein
LVIGSKGYRRNMFNTAESRLTAFHGEVEKLVVGHRSFTRRTFSLIQGGPESIDPQPQ